MSNKEDSFEVGLNLIGNFLAVAYIIGSIGGILIFHFWLSECIRKETRYNFVIGT